MENDFYYIILVNNEFPENVGFISRLMSNYNFIDLILISPQWDDYKKAGYFAHTKEGIDILNNKKIFSSLKDAILKLELNLAIGFTRRAGKNREIFDNYRDYFKDFFKKKTFKSNKIGLIFGRENTGLLDEEIKLCNTLLYIPTYSKSPSMNLSHAVSIILNELFYYRSSKNSIKSNLVLDIEGIFKPSTIIERENFYNDIFKKSSIKKLFIKNDLDSFRRMFERIFSSPIISKKDLELLKRLLLRFLFADKNE